MTMAEVSTGNWQYYVPKIFPRCVHEKASWKYDLSRPFVVNEYLYATDAKIAVRIPMPASWNLPNPERVYRGIPGAFEDSPYLPGLAANVPEVPGICSWCAGSGVSPAVHCRCPDLECEREINLPRRRCDNCHGFKVDRYERHVEVIPGVYWLARGYLGLLGEFGVSQVQVPCREGRPILQPCRFTVGEVEGILMCMHAPDPEDEDEAEP